MLKKLARNSFTGIGYGSFAYLLILLFKVQPTIPTTTNILSILIMSMGIGWISLIFEVEQFPLLAEVLFHFLGTLALVVAMMFFNQWRLSGGFWLIFISIYVICWILIRIKNFLQVEKVNLAIQKRRLSKKSK